MNDDQRRPISRRLRFEILRRDNYTCRYCGAGAPEAKLTVDHVVPVALGGGDEPTNLITACDDCNGGKASSNPDEALVADVDATAFRWAKAIEQAAEIRRIELEHDAAIAARFDVKWRSWHYGTQEWVLPRTTSWAQIVRNYIAAGLTEADLLANVDIAMNSSAKPDMTWRYFCGVCKNEIGRRQELARLLIEDGIA